MKKLCIVDDEVLIGEILAGYLSEDYEITVFADSRKAMPHLLENNYDLILSDIKMPGITGLELLAAVREVNPVCKFILMSGHGDNDAEVLKVMRDPNTKFLPKPFESLDDIDEAILELLSK